MPQSTRSQITAATLALALLASCASPAEKIAPASVSQFAYRDATCNQLIGEGRRLQNMIVMLGARLDKAAENDKAITAAGIIIFWPILFTLGGNQTQEAEYSRVTGEYEAVQQAIITKDCPIWSQSGKVTASVGDPTLVPGLNERGRGAYAEFLQKPFPRAFVLADGGKFYYAWSRRPRDPSDPTDPAARAMKNCLKLGFENCRFYAIDDRVVLQ